MTLATDALLRHLQEFGYRHRPFLTDLSAAPRGAESFEDQLYYGVLGYEREAFGEARALLTRAAARPTPAGDAAWFYLALTLQREGQEPAALEAFVQAFRHGQRLGPALLEAACLAQRLRDEGTAVALFRQYLAAAGDQGPVRQLLTLEQLHAYNRALAEVSPRVARLLAPCALVGSAQAQLPPRTERTLAALLDATWDDLLAGRLSRPEHAGRWTEAPLRRRRVMLVFARHINCSEDFVESDVLHHLQASARARGHAVEVFHADRLLYGEGALPNAVRRIDGAPWRPDAAALAPEQARLAAAIEAFAPDLVLLEANFLPTATTVSPQFFATLPTRRHFSLVAVVPDLYDQAPDFGGAWAGEADRVLAFNDQGRHAQALREAGKLLYFPNLPFAPNPHSRGPRHWDFVFAGSLQRGRDAVLATLTRHVSSHRVVGTDRRASTAMPSVDDFYRLLAEGRVTFNTGWLPPPHAPIQTGRAVEAMQARTVLLEESYAALARSYVPFVHFVPVAQAAQAVAWTQFFARHEAHRERMADAALAFVEQCYSPRHFWTMLETSA